jgi:aryl carrier-like protein
MRLDFFVMYSSLASMFGSAGQGNHAAANAFMDALALQRRTEGLPAVSIAWGAWSEIGAAADLGQRIDARGFEAITPERGLGWLDSVTEANLAQVAVFPVRWPRFLAQPEAARPLFAQLRQHDPEPSLTSSSPGPSTRQEHASIVDELNGASPSRRHELLISFVGEHVARVIGASAAEAIDPRQPLHELGLDSLMAVELRNRLASGLGVPGSLPATLVFDHPTLTALSAYLADHVVLAGRPVTLDSAPTVAVPADAVDAIDLLSDAEVEELFERRTQRA